MVERYTWQPQVPISTTAGNYSELLFTSQPLNYAEILKNRWNSDVRIQTNNFYKQVKIPGNVF